MTHLLVNLPPGFHRHPALRPAYRRLAALGTVRTRSHNTPDEIRADLAWAEAVLMWSWPMLDDALLDQAPKLGFVGCIDVGRAGAEVFLRRKLPVSTSRRCWSPAVAEMALALMLNALRRVSDYHRAMRAGREAWVSDMPMDVDPRERELTGRAVGIVGLGAVGYRLAELLQPFRPQLHVHDPFASAERLAAVHATGVDIETLVRSCDVVVLCAAANAGTAKLIGRPQIRALRSQAVFINVARAALVDTAALEQRLAKGDLIACIDVFDQEPLARRASLRRRPNTYLTPHRAGGLLSSVERALGWLIDDYEAHRAGRPRAYPLVEAMLPGLDG